MFRVSLINLGTPNAANLEKGIGSLVNYMRLAADIGADGVIVHPGSHGGKGYDAAFPQTVDAINRVLEQSPEGPLLTLENMAGMGQHIGAKFEELGQILNEVGSPRVGICLDTQHSFAAGYDLTSEAGINAMIDEFDREIGLKNLVAVHANDSKRPLGSGVDRHDNIGEGFIGVDGFETIMSNPAFHRVPFFLEVPGAEGKGPDTQNVQILKDIRHRVGAGS